MVLSSQFLLVIYLLFLSSVLCQVTEFISIDCGGTSNYTDPRTGLAWISDMGMMNSNGKSVLVENPNGDWMQYRKRRDFPIDSTKKYCYTLGTKERRRYIVRATFQYGNLGSDQDTYPKFKLYLDATQWSTVTVLDGLRVYVKEMIIRAPSNSIDVCICCATTGSPFISTLELRPLNLSMYATDFEDNFFLKVAARINFGAPSKDDIRYPDDPYDRIWESDLHKRQNFLVGEAPGTVRISTSKNIDIRTREYPPVKVMQTAVVGTQGVLSYRLNLEDFPANARAYAYFAEIQDLGANETRKFKLQQPYMPDYSNAVVNIAENANGSYTLYEPSYMNVTFNFVLSFRFVKTRDSTQGPLLSAIEISKYQKIAAKTERQDVTVLEALCSMSDGSGWTNDGGDPCIPYSINTSVVSSIRDDSTDLLCSALSGKNIKGEIPSELKNMEALTELWLDGNSLTGPLPDMSSLINLKIVHIENNSFSGEIPRALLAGKINFKYENNPELHKRKMRFKLILGSSIGVLAILLVLFLGSLYLLHNFRRKILVQKNNEKGDSLRTSTKPSTAYSIARGGHFMDEGARSLIRKGDVISVVDPILIGNVKIESIWRIAEVAIQCVEHKGCSRPGMQEIVMAIQDAIKIEKGSDQKLSSGSSRAQSSRKTLLTSFLEIETPDLSNGCMAPSFLLVIYLLFLSSVLCQVTEFISIDCGGTSNYTDPSTGLAWISDMGMMNSNGKSVLVENPNGDWMQYRKRRDFPIDSTKKYCYTLSTKERRRYIVRATFQYGNLGSDQDTYPKFKLYLDATLWSTVTVLDGSRVYVKEMIIRAPSNSIDVCICCATTGTPFISTLELRPLNLSMYATDFEDDFFLKVAARINFGAPSKDAIRYPDDPYDRIWESDLDKRQNFLVGEAPGTVRINTSKNIDIRKREYPPVKVMQTAVVGTQGVLSYRLNLQDFPANARAYAYFAEIQDLGPNEMRKFKLQQPYMPEYSNAVVNIAENANGSNTLYEPSYMNVTFNFVLSFRFVKTRDSTQGPLLSAIEISKYQKIAAKTERQDVTALEALCSMSDGSGWTNNGGDPCIPVQWDWVTCSSSTPPRITKIALSGKNVKGQIPSELKNMQALTELWLDDNSLIGPLPNMSNLINLKILHIGNNSFSGEIPRALLTGKINLKYENNPELHKQRFRLIFGSSIGVLSILLVLFLGSDDKGGRLSNVNWFILLKSSSGDSLRTNTKPLAAYYANQQLTKKSDVYSFGVVLLELISGRKPVSVEDFGSDLNIVHWARSLIRKGDVISIVDPILIGNVKIESIWRIAEVAIQCVKQQGYSRPRMQEIVQAIQDAIKIEKGSDQKSSSGGSDAQSSRKTFLSSFLEIETPDLSNGCIEPSAR
ncbi:hypothetical protein EZV62_017447 [Acer yangbiense]|uniref:non-specific serine/threonine protein kinase n=1 Tax=Acer yangbiense TaxID=1000413 RepID=A0A5C7HGP1_9ROSI|nr:hypothetical protein EZV62_017447 [Acer yangbiense]